MVSVLSMACMVICGLGSILIPVGLLFWFRKKGAELLPFFIGCVVMILFAFMLEQAAHAFILGSPAGAVIQSNIKLYALYGGLMAGLFEETGRFAAFSTVLKNSRDQDMNALMYGAGHGGIEAVVVLGLTSVNNLIWSSLINSGNTAQLTASLTGEALTQAEAAIQGLIATPFWMFLIGLLERIFAIALHLALSVLVWFGVKKKEARILFPGAILVHMVVDASAVLFSGMGIGPVAIEMIVGVMTALAVIGAVYTWRRFTETTE